MQAVFDISTAAQTPLEWGAEFYREQYPHVSQLLTKVDVTALAIVLPQEEPEHTDSRRALARDLAREFTPKRVNIVAGEAGEALDTLIAYLEGAPGVTGHYLQTHE